MSTDAYGLATPHRCEPYGRQNNPVFDLSTARLLVDREALRVELSRVEGINNELVRAGKTVLNPNLDWNEKSAAMTFLAGAQPQTAEEPT